MMGNAGAELPVVVDRDRVIGMLNSEDMASRLADCRCAAAAGATDAGTVQHMKRETL